MAMYDVKVTCGERGMIFAATDEMLYSCFAVGAARRFGNSGPLPYLRVKVSDLT
jgi:1-pyrroline-4-hydroxy-2-carboxylate deaminase